MMKKIPAILLAVLMVASLCAVHAFANAMNPADGCKTEAVFKKAASPVVHDGVISDSEYTEIEINRDPEVTDMLLSWYGPGIMLESAEQFLQNVHFYVSWDETNGVNFAAKATLLETPSCAGTAADANPEYGGDEYFMFNFGFIAKIENPDDWDHEYLYRAIGINTESGELLIGKYWADGHTGYINPVAGQDFNVKVDGKTVTYEISYPLESVLKADQIENGAPKEGAEICFTLSLTGGSKGFDQNETYAVSLGDGGYMTTMRNIGDYNGAKGTFTLASLGGTQQPTESESESDPEPTSAVTDPDPTSESEKDPSGDSDTVNDQESNNQTDPSEDSDSEINPSDETGDKDPADKDVTTSDSDTDPEADRSSGSGSDTDPGSSDDGKDSEKTDVNGEPKNEDDHGSSDGNDSEKGGSDGQNGQKNDDTKAPNTNTGTGKAPKTGDPMVIIAAISAVSAAGAIIIGNKRRF